MSASTDPASVWPRLVVFLLVASIHAALLAQSFRLGQLREIPDRLFGGEIVIVELSDHVSEPLATLQPVPTISLPQIEFAFIEPSFQLAADASFTLPGIDYTDAPPSPVRFRDTPECNQTLSALSIHSEFATRSVAELYACTLITERATVGSVTR